MSDSFPNLLLFTNHSALGLVMALVLAPSSFFSIRSSFKTGRIGWQKYRTNFIRESKPFGFWLSIVFFFVLGAECILRIVTQFYWWAQK